MSIITPDTMLKLEKEYSARHFTVKKGKGLRTIIFNVLNDKDIFAFLATFLPKGRGLELGELCLANPNEADTRVFYGLTLDLDNIPRKTKLYFYEDITSLAKNNNFRITSNFPRYANINHCPTPKEFLEDVNRVLPKPRVYAVDLLSFITKKR